MKRVRESQETTALDTQAGQIPPPPPPRRLPANVFTATHDDIPPPPPPRRPAAFTGSEVFLANGAQNGEVSAVSPTTATSTSSSPSLLPPAHNGSKRARFFGLEPPPGWRAKADTILSKAEAGVGGEGGGEGGERLSIRGGRGGSMSRRKFAVVCSANFNRSMMAHKLLEENRFQVESYGTGRDVRLPGRDAASPEVFVFGTPYRDIFDTLSGKDETLFRRNNLLGLVARNAMIKAAPQRFQEIEGAEVESFDVVLCFDSKVFYLVVEDLQSRDPETFKPLHVVNMTIRDSPEDSAAAAGDVLDLCLTLDEVSKLEDKAAGALAAFSNKTKRNVLHQVCHV